MLVAAYADHPDPRVRRRVCDPWHVVRLAVVVVVVVVVVVAIVVVVALVCSPTTTAAAAATTYYQVRVVASPVWLPSYHPCRCAC